MASKNALLTLIFLAVDDIEAVSANTHLARNYGRMPHMTEGVMNAATSQHQLKDWKRGLHIHLIQSPSSMPQ